MPRVIVKLYAGRSDRKRVKRAEEITKAVMASVNCAEDSVSVGIEDIRPDSWTREGLQTRYPCELGQPLQETWLQLSLAAQTYRRLSHHAARYRVEGESSVQSFRKTAMSATSLPNATLRTVPGSHPFCCVGTSADHDRRFYQLPHHRHGVAGAPIACASGPRLEHICGWPCCRQSVRGRASFSRVVSAIAAVPSERLLPACWPRSWAACSISYRSVSPVRTSPPASSYLAAHCWVRPKLHHHGGC